MPSVGVGVQEIRIRTDPEHRVLYIAKFVEAVYVLHAFEEQTKRTPKKAIDVAKQRLRAVLNLRVRSELLTNLQHVITERGLRQAKAAEILGVTQPRVSDLMRGQIDLFNVETLIGMLAKCGVRTKVVLETRRRRVGVA